MVNLPVAILVIVPILLAQRRPSFHEGSGILPSFRSSWFVTSLDPGMVAANQTLNTNKKNAPRYRFGSKNWRSRLRQKQNVWERSGKYQGDIILPRYYNKSRNAMYGREMYWPNGEVPYALSPNFSEKETEVILQALEYLANKTCVKPRPWEIHDRWGLYFSEKPGHGCSTLVGFWKKRQTVNLDVSIGCVQFGVVVHEVCHSLGLWHQQSAHYRDKYISIKWENIRQGMEYNFDKASGKTGSFGLEYDYDSIMHYSAYAFSANGQKTIVPKQRNSGLRMGQRNGLSVIDIQKLKIMYNCK